MQDRDLLHNPTHRSLLPNLNRFRLLGRCDIEYGSVLDTGIFINPKNSRDTDYNKYFKELYSQGTLIGHFWTIREEGADSPNWTNLDKAVDKLRKDGKTVKLHALTWNNNGIFKNAPPDKFDWYRNLPTNVDRQKALKQHVQETIAHFKGKVDIYDLVNHAATHGPSDNYMLTGWERVQASKVIFGWARQIDKNATYLVNETIAADSSTNAYVSYIQNLIDSGVKPDAIGIMEHYGGCTGEIPTDQEIMSRIGKLTKFKIPIHVTEFDMSYHNGFNCSGQAKVDPTKPFKGFPTWYDYQAWAYQHILALYSQIPEIERVNMWGFTDYSHWRPDAGILDGNVKPKQSYQNVSTILKKVDCRR